MSTALEPTFSAREAAAILGHSYSWLDQRDRNGDFVLPDGTVLQPSRTPGGDRTFDVETVGPWRGGRQVERTGMVHCMPSEMLVFGGAHGGSETDF